MMGRSLPNSTKLLDLKLFREPTRRYFTRIIGETDQMRDEQAAACEAERWKMVGSLIMQWAWFSSTKLSNLTPRDGLWLSYKTRRDQGAWTEKNDQVQNSLNPLTYK